MQHNSPPSCQFEMQASRCCNNNMVAVVRFLKCQGSEYVMTLQANNLQGERGAC